MYIDYVYTSRGSNTRTGATLLSTEFQHHSDVSQIAAYKLASVCSFNIVDYSILLLVRVNPPTNIGRFPCNRCPKLVDRGQTQQKRLLRDDLA